MAAPFPGNLNYRFKCVYNMYINTEDSYLQVLNIMSLQAVNSYFMTNLCCFLHCPWSWMELLKMSLFRKCLVQILAITLHDRVLQFSSDPPCKYHRSTIRLWISFPFHYSRTALSFNDIHPGILTAGQNSHKSTYSYQTYRDHEEGAKLQIYLDIS